MATAPAVRDITRKEYELLVPGQKAFYDGLIAAGRVRIIDEHPHTTKTKTERPPQSQSQPQPQPRERYRDLIWRFRGQPVTVTLMNGASLEGVVEEISQFEIMIDGAIVLKHAIATIRCR